MKILQGGVPKCGNFWLYQIIQQILIRSGNSNRSFIEQQPIYQLAKNWDLNYPEQSRIDVLDVTDLQESYRISSIFRMPIEKLEDYVENTSHVWTHSPICKRSEQVFSCFDKIIYIVRDPRDRALSAAKYYCSPYMLKYFPQPEKEPKVFLEKNLAALMHEWVWHVFDHLRYSQQYNIHVVFYENLLNDFQQELEKILDYLEIKLVTDEKNHLEDAVSFKTLKAKNPKHLNKGTSGYWMDNLSDDQISTAEKLAGPMIRFLGYPENRGAKFQKIDFSPRQDYEALRQAIIEQMDNM